MHTCKAFLLGAGLVVSGTAGCTADIDLLRATATARLAGVAALEPVGIALPLRGTLEGSDRATLPPEGRCAASPSHPITLVVEATGAISHLGNARWQSSHCAFVGNILDGIESVDGQGVITAANGDQLHIVYDARGTMIDFDPEPPFGFTLRVDGSVHVSGGTGRFHNARTDEDQPIALHGVFRSREERIAFVLDGWFLYQAGDRRP